MRYLFILGRNPELSILELKSYFNKENFEILDEETKENSFFVNLNQKLNERTIDFLGGTVAIGESIEEGEVKDLIKNLDKTLIYSGKENNINYSIWNFATKESYEEILFYLKKRFKQEKLKASLKSMSGEINLQSGEIFRINSSKNIDEEYFLFSSEKIEKNYFGKLIQKSNYEEIEKRDMKKPIRRESLAISPRLAKIMINLSEVKENETLLDPFCGIGIILEEALHQKIKVIGIDLDKNAINGANENLKWFGFDKTKYSLFNADSSKIEIPSCNAIVTEPDLGETLKKVPTKEKAEEILKNFENLMIKVLNNLKKKISGKIVFSSPLVKIGKKRIGCDIEKISEMTKLNILQNGIDEFRENQIVGRRIFVLTKF